MKRPFTLIAHRGFSSRAPENTIAAFDMALEHGFDNFELDAQLTSDGVPVVIHDDAVDRTADGSGPVASFALTELQNLDAGSWFGDDGQFAGANVPPLEDVLQRYHGRAHIHLELKSSEPELPAAVASLLAETGWLAFADGREFTAPGLTVTSFSLEQLERSLEVLGRDVRHGWLVRNLDQETIDTAKAAGIAGIYPLARESTAESVAAAVESGFSVRGWGVRSEADLKALYEAGAAGTTVDWPDRAQEYLSTL